MEVLSYHAYHILQTSPHVTFFVCTAEENTTQPPFQKCRGYHGHDTWQKEMHFSTTSKTSMPTGRDVLKWTETNLKKLLHGKPCPQIITH